MLIFEMVVELSSTFRYTVVPKCNQLSFAQGTKKDAGLELNAIPINLLSTTECNVRHYVLRCRLKETLYIHATG